jgi:hypothetical protein
MLTMSNRVPDDFKQLRQRRSVDAVLNKGANAVTINARSENRRWRSSA